VSLPLVAIGGPPGSGKTTAARETARQLGLEYESAGDRFRALAQERGMDLGEFSRYAAAHPEVDRQLDEEMLRFATPGHLLDSRLAGLLSRRRGTPVLYLVVTAREDVRAQRLAGRDGASLPVARREMVAREESERNRYKALYGIDLNGEAPDLTVDSSELSPAAVVERLVDFIRHRGTPAPS
jgi:CMP/dCMP kinase